MLGLKIKRDQESQTPSISQRLYIDSVLTRYGFEDAKLLAIPIVANSTLSRNDCPTTTSDIGKMARCPYREAVGSLMYAAVVGFLLPVPFRIRYFGPSEFASF